MNKIAPFNVIFIIILYGLSFNVHALMCDHNKTPEENAQREGAEPETEEFCKRLAQKRYTNLMAASKKYKEIASWGRTGEFKPNGRIILPGEWTLNQITDEWAFFVNAELHSLPSSIYHIIAIRRSTIDGVLKRGTHLISIAAYLGRLEDTVAQDTSGFDVKVRRYEIFNPLTRSDVDTIADEVRNNK